MSGTEHNVDSQTQAAEQAHIPDPMITSHTAEDGTETLKRDSISPPADPLIQSLKQSESPHPTYDGGIPDTAGSINLLSAEEQGLQPAKSPRATPLRIDSPGLRSGTHTPHIETPPATDDLEENPLADNSSSNMMEKGKAEDNEPVPPEDILTPPPGATFAPFPTDEKHEEKKDEESHPKEDTTEAGIPDEAAAKEVHAPSPEEEASEQKVDHEQIAEKTDGTPVSHVGSTQEPREELPADLGDDNLSRAVQAGHPLAGVESELLEDDSTTAGGEPSIASTEQTVAAPPEKGSEPPSEHASITPMVSKDPEESKKLEEQAREAEGVAPVAPSDFLKPEKPHEPESTPDDRSETAPPAPHAPVEDLEETDGAIAHAAEEVAEPETAEPKQAEEEKTEEEPTAAAAAEEEQPTHDHDAAKKLEELAAATALGAPAAAILAHQKKSEETLHDNAVEEPEAPAAPTEAIAADTEGGITLGDSDVPATEAAGEGVQHTPSEQHLLGVGASTPPPAETPRTHELVEAEEGHSTAVIPSADETAGQDVAPLTDSNTLEAALNPTAEGAALAAGEEAAPAEEEHKSAEGEHPLTDANTTEAALNPTAEGAALAVGEEAAPPAEEQHHDDAVPEGEPQVPSALIGSSSGLASDILSRKGAERRESAAEYPPPEQQQQQQHQEDAAPEGEPQVPSALIGSSSGLASDILSRKGAERRESAAEYPPPEQQHQRDAEPEAAPKAEEQHHDDDAVPEGEPQVPSALIGSSSGLASDILSRKGAERRQSAAEYPPPGAEEIKAGTAEESREQAVEEVPEEKEGEHHHHGAEAALAATAAAIGGEELGEAMSHEPEKEQEQEQEPVTSKFYEHDNERLEAEAPHPEQSQSQIPHDGPVEAPMIAPTDAPLDGPLGTDESVVTDVSTIGAPAISGELARTGDFHDQQQPDEQFDLKEQPTGEVPIEVSNEEFGQHTTDPSTSETPAGAAPVEAVGVPIFGEEHEHEQTEAPERYGADTPTPEDESKVVAGEADVPEDIPEEAKDLDAQREETGTPVIERIQDPEEIAKGKPDEEEPVEEIIASSPTLDRAEGHHGEPDEHKLDHDEDKGIVEKVGETAAAAAGAVGLGSLTKEDHDEHAAEEAKPEETPEEKSEEKPEEKPEEEKEEDKGLATKVAETVGAAAGAVGLGAFAHEVLKDKDEDEKADEQAEREVPEEADAAEESIPPTLENKQLSIPEGQQPDDSMTALVKATEIAHAADDAGVPTGAGAEITGHKPEDHDAAIVSTTEPAGEAAALAVPEHGTAGDSTTALVEATEVAHAADEAGVPPSDGAELIPAEPSEGSENVQRSSGTEHAPVPEETANFVHDESPVMVEAPIEEGHAPDRLLSDDPEMQAAVDADPELKREVEQPTADQVLNEQAKDDEIVETNVADVRLEDDEEMKRAVEADPELKKEVETPTADQVIHQEEAAKEGVEGEGAPTEEKVVEEGAVDIGDVHYGETAKAPDGDEQAESHEHEHEHEHDHSKLAAAGALGAGALAAHETRELKPETVTAPEEHPVTATTEDAAEEVPAHHATEEEAPLEREPEHPVSEESAPVHDAEHPVSGEQAPVHDVEAVTTEGVAEEAPPHVEHESEEVPSQVEHERQVEETAPSELETVPTRAPEALAEELERPKEVATPEGHKEEEHKEEEAAVVPESETTHEPEVKEEEEHKEEEDHEHEHEHEPEAKTDEHEAPKEAEHYEEAAAATTHEPETKEEQEEPLAVAAHGPEVKTDEYQPPVVEGLEHKEEPEHNEEEEKGPVDNLVDNRLGQAGMGIAALGVAAGAASALTSKGDEKEEEEEEEDEEDEEEEHEGEDHEGKKLSRGKSLLKKMKDKTKHALHLDRHHDDKEHKEEEAAQVEREAPAEETHEHKEEETTAPVPVEREATTEEKHEHEHPVEETKEASTHDHEHPVEETKEASTHDHHVAEAGAAGLAAAGTAAALHEHHDNKTEQPEESAVDETETEPAPTTEIPTGESHEEAPQRRQSSFNADEPFERTTAGQPNDIPILDENGQEITPPTHDEGVPQQSFSSFTDSEPFARTAAGEPDLPVLDESGANLPPVPTREDEDHIHAGQDVTILSSHPGQDKRDTFVIPPAESGEGLVFDDDLAREIDRQNQGDYAKEGPTEPDETVEPVETPAPGQDDAPAPAPKEVQETPDLSASQAHYALGKTSESAEQLALGGVAAAAVAAATAITPGDVTPRAFEDESTADLLKKLDIKPEAVQEAAKAAEQGRDIVEDGGHEPGLLANEPEVIQQSTRAGEESAKQTTAEPEATTTSAESATTTAEGSELRQRKAIVEDEPEQQPAVEQERPASRSDMSLTTQQQRNMLQTFFSVFFLGFFGGIGRFFGGMFGKKKA